MDYERKFKTEFKFKNTGVMLAGVFRCCPASIGEQLADDAVVKLGDKISCTYCKEFFTLIDGNKFPVWTPDWQIEQARKQK